MNEDEMVEGDIRDPEIRKVMCEVIDSLTSGGRTMYTIWENDSLPKWGVRITSERIEASRDLMEALQKNLQDHGVNTDARVSYQSDYN